MQYDEDDTDLPDPLAPADSEQNDPQIGFVVKLWLAWAALIGLALLAIWGIVNGGGK